MLICLRKFEQFSSHFMILLFGTYTSQIKYCVQAWLNQPQLLLWTPNLKVCRSRTKSCAISLDTLTSRILADVLKFPTRWTRSQKTLQSGNQLEDSALMKEKFQLNLLHMSLEKEYLNWVWFRWEISGFCLLSFCQNERFSFLSLNTFWGKCVYF